MPAVNDSCDVSLNEVILNESPALKFYASRKLISKDAANRHEQRSQKKSILYHLSVMSSVLRFARKSRVYEIITQNFTHMAGF